MIPIRMCRLNCNIEVKKPEGKVFFFPFLFGEGVIPLRTGTNAFFEVGDPEKEY
jgi:hypothetical protein